MGSRKKNCIKKKKFQKFGTRKIDLEYVTSNNVLRKRFRSNVKNVTKSVVMPPYTEEQYKRYCMALFGQDTLPYQDLERYILMLHQCVLKKGKRKFTADENVLLVATEALFTLLIKNFSHAGLRISFMISLDSIFESLLKLIKNNSV